MWEQQKPIIHKFNDSISLIDSAKTSYLNDIRTQINNRTTNIDKRYILTMLLNAFNGLHCQNIFIYPNIVEIFQINGFKSSSLYYDAICKISNVIQKELKGNVEWINHRALKKGNKSDKNIIICFLLFTYREHFIKYLEEFLLEKKENDEEQVRNLILNLQKILSNTPNYNPNPNNNNLSITNSEEHTIVEKQKINEPKGDKNKLKKDQNAFEKTNDHSSKNNDYKNSTIKIKKIKEQNDENGLIDIDEHNFFENQNFFDECQEYNDYSNFEDDYMI